MRICAKITGMDGDVEIKFQTGRPEGNELRVRDVRFTLHPESERPSEPSVQVSRVPDTMWWDQNCVTCQEIWSAGGFGPSHVGSKVLRERFLSFGRPECPLHL